MEGIVKKKKVKKRIHTMKWERCVKDIGKTKGIKSPEVICTSKLGKTSFLKK